MGDLLRAGCGTALVGGRFGFRIHRHLIRPRAADAGFVVALVRLPDLAVGAAHVVIIQERPAAPDAEQAVRGADIVCTLTSSASVVLHGDWIGPGTHVNAVGASIPSMQEVDEALLLKSEVFTDYRPSAFAQAR